MCIAYLRFAPDEEWPLIVAANRDEFQRRPTEIAHYWPDTPGLLAGRDQQAGGTWLGAHPQNARFALVTNYRAPKEAAPTQPISRGTLVRDFLVSADSAQDYLAKIAAQHERYEGFNLIVGANLAQPNAELWYYSNRSGQAPEPLAPGEHLLSNHLLNSPWPKTERLRARIGAQRLTGKTASKQSATHQPQPLHKRAQCIFNALYDPTQAAEQELPRTGLTLKTEKQLSSIFIVGEQYGSRCSTALQINAQGQGLFSEQSYGPNGQPTDRIDWPLNLRLAKH